MKNQIAFTHTENALHVEMDTKRLHLESASKSHLNLYYDNLYSNAKVMEKFGYGKTIEYNTLEEWVNGWVYRWESVNPFSAFAITDRNIGEFVGSVVLAPSKDVPGAAVVAILLKEEYWGKGFASEVSEAMLTSYVPELIERQYKVNDHEFTTILATARPDNLSSVGTLVKSGFKYEGQKEMYGNLRNEYSLNVASIVKKNEPDSTSAEVQSEKSDGYVVDIVSSQDELAGYIDQSDILYPSSFACDSNTNCI